MLGRFDDCAVITPITVPLDEAEPPPPPPPPTGRAVPPPPELKPPLEIERAAEVRVKLRHRGLRSRTAAAACGDEREKARGHKKRESIQTKRHEEHLHNVWYRDTPTASGGRAI
jgi:hypothetical protein